MVQKLKVIGIKRRARRIIWLTDPSADLSPADAEKSHSYSCTLPVNLGLLVHDVDMAPQAGFGREPGPLVLYYIASLGDRESPLRFLLFGRTRWNSFFPDHYLVHGDDTIGLTLSSDVFRFRTQRLGEPWTGHGGLGNGTSGFSSHER